MLHSMPQCMHRVDQLTWQGGAVPLGEVWVKLGGDKGGSSMKVNFQVCNVPAPNSLKNTCVFAAFEAPDTAHNLRVALSRYQEQVQELQSLIWRLE